MLIQCSVVHDIINEHWNVLVININDMDNVDTVISSIEHWNVLVINKLLMIWTMLIQCSVAHDIIIEHWNVLVININEWTILIQ